ALMCSGTDSGQNEVSTGSGSDRVAIIARVETTNAITRSLPLPVLTSIITISSFCQRRFGNHLRVLATANPSSYGIDQDNYRRRHDQRRQRSVDVTLRRRCGVLGLRPEAVA